MDSALMLLLLAGVAGFGGGGIAGGVAAGSAVGYTPDPEKPPRKWPGWCRRCPPFFGAILAVIIWAAIRADVEPAVGVLGASMVGFTAGAAGGILSDMIGGFMK